MRMLRRVVLALGLVGCTTPTNPNVLPDGAVWLDPVPTEYANDWRSVEACSGLTGDFASVRWMVYPGRLVIPGTMNLGQTHHQSRIIELAGAALAPVWRHEMLHLLLGPSGDNHPVEYFVTRCGDVVAH